MMEMAKISYKRLGEIYREYFKKYGIKIFPITQEGKLLVNCVERSISVLIKNIEQIRASALQQALHWGEPYVFSPIPGLISWVVPLVDGHLLEGGLIGGEVFPGASAKDNAFACFNEYGIKDKKAYKYFSKVPVWEPTRIREASLFLEKLFYESSGWKPLLLEENKSKALQQRQIADAMQEQKNSGASSYPVEKERMLLAFIRAGDRNSARRILNEMLGAMFLFSPKLPVLRARAIEMMGYLTRAAVEDSPLLEPLIERNHQWMQKLINAKDFENLAHILMRALEDFMQGIYARGLNYHNVRVGKAVDYIASHYTESITLSDVAKAIGISSCRLSHLLKEQTGKSFLQHIIRLRIKKAQELLERSSMSSLEIAMELGFCDQSYFIKHFKRIVGITPSKYRRSHTTLPEVGGSR
jgi:two-component system response regulator YesN